MLCAEGFASKMLASVRLIAYCGNNPVFGFHVVQNSVLW